MKSNLNGFSEKRQLIVYFGISSFHIFISDFNLADRRESGSKL